MEKNQEIINDLKLLVDIVNDGKEGYTSAGEVTDSLELKALFLKYAAQRIAYAAELKQHIALHGGESKNEEGGILGILHRTWIDIKQALSSREEVAVLGAVETGEEAALEKYDQILEKEILHADHISMLQKQRSGILEALKEIETHQVRLEKL
ncbi:PA2169 family four-helix-bundle protein [Pedobacter sp. ASV28]|uniref:PA2169 family four-helix-bundle protein n=1 Tax=Pedobacter sp. ASV28 TaxID=2795123 RepID=UPI0018EC1FE0|nr:PA2169 family four-helix-bundle protein [Pedobacter sp. ASV28]